MTRCRPSPIRSTPPGRTALLTVGLLIAAATGCGRCSRSATDGTGVHPVFAAARASIFALGGQQAGIQGSAFLVRRGGRRYLVSSFHVVARLTRPFIESDRGTRFPGLKVLAVDRPHDVAILDASTLPTAVPALACSTRVITSQAVYLMGYPAMGWDDSHLNFASGVVSDAHFQAPALLGRGSMEYIQATTPINLGHSGSPLLDARGRVLGVVAWRYEPGSEIQDGNYAVPIRHALALIDGLRAGPSGGPGQGAELHASRGRSCTQDADCQGLDFCLQQKCQPLRSAGQACASDEDCYLPLVCHGGACAEPRGPGETCDGDYLCRPPLVCVLAACRELGQAGDVCGRDQDCDWPLVCRQGRCARGPARPAERAAGGPGKCPRPPADP